jgi:membrane-bound lytic murein transglycosylase D
MASRFMAEVALAATLAAGVAHRLPAQSLEFDELFDALDRVVSSNLDLSPAEVAALAGTNELRLAPVREAAAAVLPVLEQDTQTREFAAWLREAVQSLGTAEVLRLEIPAPRLELPAPPLPPATPLEPPIWPVRPRPAEWPAAARAHVNQLKPIFVEEGVPAELVWLAEVESGFDPKARSRAGAAGLFQLMPDTAELMGLSVRPVDERFVPVKSARAAAQYLRYLHEKFGDWRLAVAAYNGGEGRVGRLLDQSPARTYAAIASRLPAETQMYVAKVEAALLRREGLALSELRWPGRAE